MEKQPKPNAVPKKEEKLEDLRANETPDDEQEKVKGGYQTPSRLQDDAE